MLKSFFDPNGAFARGMERVWSLIVLNVLWLVCSLPVVTMGASCAALYQVLGKLIAGEDGHVARQFFRAWGENWKKATPVWMILLAVGHLPRMLLIWAVWAVPVGVSVFIPEVGFYLSIVWVLIGYSSLSYVTALLLRPVFRNLDENA